MKSANKPRVEGSTEHLNTTEERRFNLTGLEDIGRSIIPVPFYTFVQPSSKKAFLPNGERAQNGTFLMKDVREVVKSLRVVILRAKRATRIENNDLGQPEKVVSLQVLGINLERQRPFILSVPVTSFSAFGALFEDMERRKAKSAWDYPAYLTSTEVSRPKETPQGIKNVNYWVIDASLEPKELPEKDKQIAYDAYIDFASKLDRDGEDDDALAEIAGK